MVWRRRFVDSSPGVGWSSMFVNTTMEDEDGGAPAEPARRKAAATASLNISKRNATSMKRVSSILRKKRDSLTLDDKRVLEENPELVEQFYKRRERRAVWQSRKTEQEDTREILQAKCEQLAQAIHDAEFLVVYTGAGISTAASIPDYRGPNGIWTLLQKGLDIGDHDLSAAEPTLTHMALSALYQQGIVRHVVSQNCDGLHLRSGLPKTAMSEVHGNMYIEVCKHCVPAREYVRTFDVTERTSIYKHTTGRRCYRCGEPLIDTIVHFGERGKLRWPLNWQGACQAANACDTILCLGSSLKVLKKYPWLWQMDRSPKKRPRLYIVNLQWTPKDKDATLKINGKCDEVMSLVMKALGYELPVYSRSSDPIFSVVTPLHPAEAATSTRPRLIPPPEDDELNIVENQDSVITGYDVRWDGKAQGSREDHGKVKAEIMEKDIKDEKYDIKNESDFDVKPANGIYMAWNEEKMCWRENLASHVKMLVHENIDKLDCKPGLSQVDDEIKSENCSISTFKEESEDIKEERSWNNGKDFSCELNQLYRALTSKSKSTEGLKVPMDEGEVKSEPTDSDEDFQTSDTEGEPWSSDKLAESTLDGEINFLKSSDSSCSDSDSSEQAEDCQTEDSDVNNLYPQPQKPNNMDYFKLAYASTNVQMAKQGQALLKQNDFYGTGLCIRSFVNCSKNDDRSSKMSLKSERSDTDVAYEETTFKNKVGSADRLRHKQFVDVRNNDHEHKQSVCLTVRDRNNAAFPVIPRITDESSSLPNYHKSPLPAVTLCSSDYSNKLPLCSGECRNKFCMYSSNCSNKTINYNHEFDVTTVAAEQSNMLYKVNVPCGSVRQTPKLELRKVNESEIAVGTKQLSSVLRVSDISDAETDNEKSGVLTTDNMVCCGDKHLVENSSRATDGSFLLRTHIVDGIIRAACVETLADDKPEFRNVSVPPQKNAHMVTLTSHTDITGVTVTSCSDTQRALISSCNKSSVCQENLFTEAHLGAVTHLSRSKNLGSKISTQLDISESDVLKSVWHQSFCGSSNENNLSASTVMMSMKGNEPGKCENGTPSYVHHRVSEMIQSPEKTSSVILKNICTEAVNDSVARQKGSTKRKLKGCDNEDVKYIWFWGFGSTVENKERESIEEDKFIGTSTLTAVNHMGEVNMDTKNDNGCIPVRRITRSRTRASSDSRSAPEIDVFRCHCNGSNPELCKMARLRPSRVKCDADVEKAREIIRKRRTYNYRKYEPVFEKKLESFTYERAKAKRKSKFESTHDNEEEEEEEEYEEQDNEVKEDEHKISDGEDCRERDEKGERRITPGWYGKGLRKGIKKKTRV
ncbi:uncharacterized protein Sirt7 [Panulirus ornatus]|uniref:uncharacterized protein Sirt7 n=1 Tax=Panulirus ornatus TaxID=150431 RepID=UPI003A8934FC